jgi:hypothetical protein
MQIRLHCTELQPGAKSATNILRQCRGMLMQACTVVFEATKQLDKQLLTNGCYGL